MPDARTNWDFKQALELDGWAGARKLFERFEQLLTEGGLIERKGSFVDAPRQRNSRKENEQIKEREEAGRI